MTMADVTMRRLVVIDGDRVGHAIETVLGRSAAFRTRVFAIRPASKKAGRRIAFAVAFVVLSLLFVLIWAFSGGASDGFEGFWPIWPIAGIALGVIFTGIRAFGAGAGGPSEGRIQSEMKRLSE